MAADTILIGGDLPVRRVGFGAMRITGHGYRGEPRDPGAAKEVLRRAVELGVNFIDTADTFIPWFPLGRGDLAWLLHRSPVTLPIPGTTSVRHLEENAASLALELTEEEIEALSGYKLGGLGALRRKARDRLRPLLVPVVGKLSSKRG